MKKLLPFIALAIVLAVIGRALMSPKNPGAFDVVGFSKLPVLVNGRIKPVDTIARVALLQFQGRQTVTAPDETKLMPVEWLLDVIFNPEKADTYQTFEIVHPDVLALFDLKAEDGAGEKRFSLKQLQPKIDELKRQTELARQVEQALRTPFQRAVAQIYGNLVEYQRIRHAFVAPDSANFLDELLKFQDNLAAGRAAVMAKMNQQPHDETLAAATIGIMDRFWVMSESTTIHAIPPPPSETDPAKWKTTGGALMETFRTGQVNAAALAYAGFANAWRTGKSDQFNKLIELYRADLGKRFEKQLKKSDTETRFNSAQPFYISSVLYGLAFFIAIASWLVMPESLRRSAAWMTAAIWLLSTTGILVRMWLDGRPPVTNLYSSALFVGWGAVGLCLVLEYFFKNSIPTVAAGAIGSATLIIAHHLSLSGDTLEMMQAVLDSNFWLATHVIIITAGYSATFLAGFLALIYIVRGVFTSTLDKPTGDALSRMVYGIVCFATLFSFVGTILGGIWADQSWGRFWGWDPKENGALVIVIWNAIILHARWGGMVKQRGLMNLAIGGNIVTAWSWFGTNLLGVGLHTYGFSDGAFTTLWAFVASQVVLIIVGCLPLRMWGSFKSGRATIPAQPEHVEELPAAGR